MIRSNIAIQLVCALSFLFSLKAAGELGPQLHMAIMSKKLDKINEILNNNPAHKVKEAVNYQVMQGMPHLLEDAIVRAADPEIIRALIDKGADVNRFDNVGRRALDYALIYGSKPEIAKILLENGAKLGTYDHGLQAPFRQMLDVHGPLDHPSRKIRVAIIKGLLEHQRKNQAEIIKLIKQYQAGR